MGSDLFNKEYSFYKKWKVQNVPNNKKKDSNNEKPNRRDDFDMFDFYKLSTRRFKRTSYNSSFIFDTKNDANENNNFKENYRLNHWFTESVPQFDAESRLNSLVKPVERRNSLDQRYKLFRRNDDYKYQKENQFSSVKMYQDLNDKTESLIKTFRQNY
jgi:hypothetical protein